MNQGNMMRVPVSGPVTGIEETEAVIRVMESKHYAGGRVTEQFEHEFAAYIGKRYGLFVNSGSSANLLAVTALNEYHKQSYIFYTPALAFPTTINPLIQTGQSIRLVDVDIETLQPRLANYGAMTLGNYHHYSLIEDSCDAMFPGQYTGLAQTFSFFPAHHMTTGQGGMLTTDDAEFYRIARSYRDWGRDCWCLPGMDNTCGKRFDQQFGDLPEGYDHKYVYSRIGYNLSATDMQAAMGLAQLKKLDTFSTCRMRNFHFLYNRLEKYSNYFIMPKQVRDNTPWFGFPLTIRDNAGFTRKKIVTFLDGKGVGTRLMFAGNVTKQPAYKGIQFEIPEPLTNCDKIMRDSFWIGCWHGLTIDHLDYSIAMIEEFIGGL